MADFVKVSSKSRPALVAGATPASATPASATTAGADVAGIVREQHHVEVRAIGAGAVNQAVKAIAIGRKYLERDGLDIACVPTFADVDVEGAERTAIKIAVEVSRAFAPVAPPVSPEPPPNS